MEAPRQHLFNPFRRHDDLRNAERLSSLQAHSDLRSGDDRQLSVRLMVNDSHGNTSTNVPRAHDDLRGNMAAMSPAGMAQMEAVAQVHDVRLGIMPPMHNELLLPLLPNAPTAPQHNAGHQHAYGVHQQMQMPPSDVPYTMMFPAGANDHGELVAGRGPRMVC